MEWRAQNPLPKPRLFPPSVLFHWFPAASMDSTWRVVCYVSRRSSNLFSALRVQSPRPAAPGSVSCCRFNRLQCVCNERRRSHRPWALPRTRAGSLYVTQDRGILAG